MKRFVKLAGLWSLIFCVFTILNAGCSSEETSSKNNKVDSDVALETDAQIATDVDTHDVVEASDTDKVEKDVAVDAEQTDVKDDTTDTSDGDKDAEVVADVEADVESDVIEEVDVESDVIEEVDVESDVIEEVDVPKVEPDAPVVDEDEYEGRPLGQCNEDLECDVMAGGYRDCRANVPGGVCGACGANDCGPTAECASGACQEYCTKKEDCAPGLVCSSRGHCGAERCVANKCPTPLFGCSDSGLCQRITCGQQEDCPELTTCTKGFCIENRQL